MLRLRFIYILVLVLTGKILSAQTLDSLLSLIKANNPTLKALEMQYQIVLQEAERLGHAKLQFGLNLPISPPETRLGAQVITLNANQVFPWFGTLKAEQKMRLTMAKIDYENITVTCLELFHQLKLAYYRLYFLERKEAVLRENRQLYHILKNITLAKVKNGTTTIVDVMRIEVNIEDLKQQIRIVNNDKRQFYAIINSLLNHSIADPIYPSNLDTVAVLNFNIQELKAKIKNQQPLIAQLNHQLKVAQEAQFLNQKQSLPQVGIGMTYGMIRSRTDADPTGNGRDIMIPKVILNVPLDRRMYRAKHRQEELRKQRLENQKTNLINQFFRQLETYQIAYQNALLKLALVKSQKQTIQTAYDILVADYSSSKASHFDDLLALLNQLLNYDLKFWEAATETHVQKANIQKLTDF